MHGILPVILVNKRCHGHQRWSQGELVSLEGTQKGKEYLPSSSHQTVANPYNKPRGNSGCENIGHWP